MMLIIAQSTERPLAKTYQENEHTYARSWFLIAIPLKRKQGLTEETDDSTAGKGKVQMNLVHFIFPESNEGLKKW